MYRDYLNDRPYVTALRSLDAASGILSRDVDRHSADQRRRGRRLRRSRFSEHDAGSAELDSGIARRRRGRRHRKLAGAHSVAPPARTGRLLDAGLSGRRIPPRRHGRHCRPVRSRGRALRRDCASGSCCAPIPTTMCTRTSTRTTVNGTWANRTGRAICCSTRSTVPGM